MRFSNMTNIGILNVAGQKAEMLLTPPSKMLTEIMGKHDWKYGEYPSAGWEIAARLVYERESVKLLTYRPFNPFTKAIAMTNGDGAIHFNVYKIHKRSLSEIVGTILHEYAHLCGFKHGSNYKTKEKCLHSVPYFLSENVERWL